MTNYSAADLLDQLMGPNRNMAPGEKPRKLLHWSDPSVCKNFLCGFCPHELFMNTKADMGNCSMIHDDNLRKMYEESSDYGQMGYEETFLHFITKIVNNCETKISRGYERLRNRKPIFLDPADKEAYDKIDDKISATLRKVEELGIRGLVEEATQAMQTVEDLKSDLEMLAQVRFGYDREMEVCAVCGSLTLVNDLPSRFEDHLNGRQHTGYAKIRHQVQLMNENKYWKKKPEETKDEKEDKDKDDKTKSKSSTSREKKSHRHSSDRRKERSRSRSNHRRKRSDRSRSRSPRRHSRHSREKRHS